MAKTRPPYTPEFRRPLSLPIVSVTPTRLATAEQISELALDRRQISIEMDGRRLLGAWNLQGRPSRVSANADRG
jgi:hypothetical protein